MASAPTIRKTRADLRRRVRNVLQDDPDSGATSPWTDTLIADELNEAQAWTQKRMANIGESWFLQTFDVEMNGVDYGFPFPGDFLREHLFERSFKGPDGEGGEGQWDRVPIVPLQQLDRYEPQWPFLRDEPRREVWYIRGNEIRTRLNSPPTGRYRLTYFARVPDLQDDDQVCEVPPDYHDVVITRAAYRCAKHVGDRYRVSSLGQELEELMVLMQEIASNRSIAQEHRVRDELDLDLY